MKLIDADELKKDDEVTMWLSNDAIRVGKQLKMFSEYFINKIDNMPTVQAVPIPDNATNGDVITAIFSSRWHNNEIIFSDDWWYSPYKRGDNNDRRT